MNQRREALLPMTHALGILCYHRIVEERELATAWPYLERGTAVRAEHFRAQVADIEQFADVVDEAGALDVLAGRRRLERPAVWFTFDDGYVDVLRARGHVPTGTVFITTSTAERPLPADAWYTVLLGATRTRGSLDLGKGRFDYDLAHREGRARLVNGPERRAYLRASGTSQETTLCELADQLEARIEDRPRLYLNAPELRELIAEGWTLGSHGVTHVRFDRIDDDEMVREARVSREVLAAYQGRIRSLALPDGARPTSSEPLLACGYECVLGLGDAAAEPRQAVHSRFLVPDDPDWAKRVLAPALREATALDAVSWREGP